MWLHFSSGGNFRRVCLGRDQADKLDLSACPMLFLGFYHELK